MVVHDNPYLSSVGSGTVVADGLSINNADFSSTSFRVSQTTIGAHNFLGNYVTYPSQGKTGDNCLLATKVMVPVDGSVREGVGLLGSPSFEIPRSVLRDTNLAPKSRDELRRKLAARTDTTSRPLPWSCWCGGSTCTSSTMLAMVVTDIYRALRGRGARGALDRSPAVLDGVLHLRGTRRGGLPTAAAAVLLDLRSLLLVARALLEVRGSRHSTGCFVGTPFKNILSRLHGVRIGKLVFDDGCAMPERTLVTIGDHCTLNAGSMVQGHSQEDGAFKSDHITARVRLHRGSRRRRPLRRLDG